jgi:signal transduction histidine kinase
MPPVALGASTRYADGDRVVPSNPPFNHLLSLLDAEVRAELSPVALTLQSRHVLYEPGTPSLYAYFPLNAVIALVSTMEDGDSTEVALIGREGMVGLAGVLGTREGATAAVVQVAGDALRVPTAVLRRERVHIPSLRGVFDRYTEARLIQFAQTAACNRLHSVEARLARWLLEIADRVDAEYFRLSQDFMAQMLGVHRPTVCLTLRGFRDAGVIAYQGRSIKVADRAGLGRLACECYGVLRREFDRLLRPTIESLGTLPQVIESAAARQSESVAALETMREISGRLLLATIREQEARDHAEAANRAKDQFLAMVSHELRTPLNAILGWSAILSERPDEAPQRGLCVIRRNAESLLKLVEELLDAARLTAETLSIQPLPIDLGEIVCAAVDAVKPSTDLKGVGVRTTVPDALPRMVGDPDRLRQVFLNVFSNALKFTEAGGEIEVCVGMIGESARVSIRDSGSGIAADELPRVFERFHQGTDATAGQRGLGLGLTIARVLVELHGGTIQIVSPGVGQGTTCTIDLPIAGKITAAARPPRMAPIPA